MNKKTTAIVSSPALLIAGALALGSTNGVDAVADTPVEAIELIHREGLKTAQLNPVVEAPEYTYHVTPDEMLNADYSYELWSKTDMLTDLYTLAEAVKTRKALERIADALEAE